MCIFSTPPVSQVSEPIIPPFMLSASEPDSQVVRSDFLHHVVNFKQVRLAKCQQPGSFGQILKKSYAVTTLSDRIAPILYQLISTVRISCMHFDKGNAKGPPIYHPHLCMTNSLLEFSRPRHSLLPTLPYGLIRLRKRPWRHTLSAMLYYGRLGIRYSRAASTTYRYRRT